MTFFRFLSAISTNSYYSNDGYSQRYTTYAQPQPVYYQPQQIIYVQQQPQVVYIRPHYHEEDDDDRRDEDGYERGYRDMRMYR